ncbi:uncharacterized protein LOC112347089 [Selaginella moellendorffii]|uniref:uncharacterized protein LOC112347089 n=1 Tax=Selaginella moellendorffii TaxID=88036 RepID=UPI000D1CFA74|nr:uncharacterized protein LOC112347089 [Selaginella moellendorffii]|eukprot:XP_024533170.1 uncharacterized protein LOC112347089 [Selaginella moellendorffii]
MIRRRLAARARTAPHDDSDLMRLDHPGLVSFLQSCGAKRDLEEGRRAHAFLERSNREPKFMNLLVKMYGRCGRVEEASICPKWASTRGARALEENGSKWDAAGQGRAQHRGHCLRQHLRALPRQADPPSRGDPGRDRRFLALFPHQSLWHLWRDLSGQECV